MFARQSQATIPPKGKNFKYKHGASTRFQPAHKKSYQVKECKPDSLAHTSTSPPPESGKNLSVSMKSGVLLLLLLAVALSSHLAPVEADRRWSRSTFSPDDTAAVTSRARMPYFAEVSEESKRHKAIVGRAVRFECVVMDLGHRSVAWFHKPRTHPLLAIGNKTHLFRDRMKASIQGNSIFSLEIKKVELQDEGEYFCQITNLPPESPQNQYHFLEVLQSPQIRENESTIKIKPVEEGKPVEMRCVAYGVPKPVIKWRRQSRLIELPALLPSDPNEVAANESADDAGATPPAQASEQLPSLQASDEQSQVATQSRVRRSLDGQDSDAELFGVRKGSRHRRAPNVAPIYRHYIGRTRRSTTPAHSHHTLTLSSAPTMATLAGSTMSLNPRISGAGNKPIRAEGEVFRIERVSRYDMGYYECIASNGVQPAVSQLIFLPVNWQSRGTGLNARNSSNSNGDAFVTSSAAGSTTSTASRTGGPITQATDEPDDRPPSKMTAGTNQTRAGASVGSGRTFKRARYGQHKAARSSAPAGSSAPATLLIGCTASLSMRLLTSLALLWCAWLAAGAA